MLELLLAIHYCPKFSCRAAKTDWVVDRYEAMRDALNKTGRPILFSMCEWGVADPWLWAQKARSLSCTSCPSAQFMPKQ